MTTPEELREIVREQVDSSALRQLVEEILEKPRGVLDAAFRHPLFITFIGFLLTSGLLWVAQLVVEQNREARDTRAAARAQISAEADEAIALLDDLVQLAHNRATELSLLRFALIDGQRDVILKRRDAYYEYYREWVTTYQPRGRQILAQMGVDASSEAEVQADPFYRALESKIGWQAFVLGHDCFRRMMVVSRAANYKSYGDWTADELFECPRRNPRLYPSSFLRESYTIARGCATGVFYYARTRIRAYEAARLAQVDDPEAALVLPDPAEGLPEACKI